MRTIVIDVKKEFEDTKRVINTKPKLKEDKHRNNGRQYTNHKTDLAHKLNWKPGWIHSGALDE